LASACAFDLPLLWFFLPPPGEARRLDRTSDRVNELYRLTPGAVPCAPDRRAVAWKA
jgi:hypothetical protein